MKFFTKSIQLLLLCIASGMLMHAGVPEKVTPVKNVILLIPDGTSLASVSLARWYQRYLNPDQLHLNIDPYICGTVVTYSSNAPIGDSAPTTSCYMTGMPSISGFISTYPWSAGKSDLIPVDSTKAFSPLATVLEAVKIKKDYKTGLVFTCEFPHATPADCSAHTPNRKDYEAIIPQMVNQNLNVVIGGGAGLLDAKHQQVLKDRGYQVYLDDMAKMKATTDGNMWALYCPRDVPNDFDRDTTQIPSLAEMTQKAIDLLNKESKGFFLMVEGSKVDWAAHANDPVGIVSEMLAFDRACKVAIDFAKADGNTTVIILPDHGNSGISIGKESFKKYDKRTKDEVFGSLARIKNTAAGMTKLVNETPNDQVQALFKEKCGFELTEEELTKLNNCIDYKQSPIPAKDRKTDKSHALYSGSLETYMAKLFTDHTSIGFTTHGHTGEEVFLACYNPNGQPLMGNVQNTDVNAYMVKLLCPDVDLKALTDEIFVPHDVLFSGLKYSIDTKGKYPVLTVKGKKHTLTVEAYTNVVTVDKGRKTQKVVEINSVMPYVKENKKFYLNQSLKELL